jgi:hypothetical protein
METNVKNQEVWYVFEIGEYSPSLMYTCSNYEEALEKAIQYLLDIEEWRESYQEYLEDLDIVYDEILNYYDFTKSAIVNEVNDYIYISRKRG